MTTTKRFKPKTKAQYDGYMLRDNVVLRRKRQGIIQYIGKVKNKKGIWIGIEITNTQIGQHNGTLDGVVYFKSKSHKGIFVQSKDIVRKKTDTNSAKTKPISKAKLRQKHKRTESSPMDMKTKPKALKQRKRKTHSKKISVPDMNALRNVQNDSIHGAKPIDLDELLHSKAPMINKTDSEQKQKQEQYMNNTIQIQSTDDNKPKQSVHTESDKETEFEEKIQHIETTESIEIHSNTEETKESEWSSHYNINNIQCDNTDNSDITVPITAAVYVQESVKKIATHSSSEDDNIKPMNIDNDHHDINGIQCDDTDHNDFTVPITDVIELEDDNVKSNERTASDAEPIQYMDDVIDIEEKKDENMNGTVPEKNKKQTENVIETETHPDAKTIPKTETIKRKDPKSNKKKRKSIKMILADSTQSPFKRKSKKKDTNDPGEKEDTHKNKKTRKRTKSSGKLADRISMFNVGTSTNISSKCKVRKKKKKIGKIKNKGSAMFDDDKDKAETVINIKRERKKVKKKEAKQEEIKEVMNKTMDGEKKEDMVLTEQNSMSPTTKFMTRTQRTISDASHGSSNSISSLNSLSEFSQLDDNDNEDQDVKEGIGDTESTMESKTVAIVVDTDSDKNKDPKKKKKKGDMNRSSSSSSSGENDGDNTSKSRIKKKKSKAMMKTASSSNSETDSAHSVDYDGDSDGMHHGNSVAVKGKKKKVDANIGGKIKSKTLKSKKKKKKYSGSESSRSDNENNKKYTKYNEIKIHPFIETKGNTAHKICLLCGESVESEGCCFIRSVDPNESKIKLDKIKEIYDTKAGTL